MQRVYVDSKKKGNTHLSIQRGNNVIRILFYSLPNMQQQQQTVTYARITVSPQSIGEQSIPSITQNKHSPTPLLRHAMCVCMKRAKPGRNLKPG